MVPINKYIDLKNRLTNRAVVGDFENTRAHVGKLLTMPGDTDTVYTYSPTVGLIFSNPNPITAGAYHHFEGFDNNKEETEFYAAEVSVMPPEVVDGKDTVDIEADVTFRELTPSKKVKDGMDEVETHIALKKSLDISSYNIEDLFYKVLFCKIKSAPIVIISKNSELNTIDDFFVKTEDDLYNSSTDSNVDITITKHIIDNNLVNIKPKSLDMTYRELSKCYVGDSIKISNGVRESENAIGIYERQDDNEYEVIYRRKDGSIDFKLDGWSNKYIDDHHIKTNVYRISETIFEDGKPQQPIPDPNYTQKRITSRDEKYDWNKIDQVPAFVEKVINATLFDGANSESKYPISLHISEEDPKENNVLIPFEVEGTNLITFSGAFPMGENELEAADTDNNLSVFVELYCTEIDPSPMWIVMSYIDPESGARITHKVLADSYIIYHDTVSTRYTAFTSIDEHTISFVGNTFRIINRNLTDIAGRTSYGSVFTYESPEIEVSIEFPRSKEPEITQFGSAIFGKDDQSWLIRSEYGCVMPYYNPLYEDKIKKMH